LVDFTFPGSTINAAAYWETFLQELKEAIQQRRPGYKPKEFILHNA